MASHFHPSLFWCGCSLRHPDFLPAGAKRRQLIDLTVDSAGGCALVATCEADFPAHFRSHHIQLVPCHLLEGHPYSFSSCIVMLDPNSYDEQ